MFLSRYIKLKNYSTSAGIRTRVLALATPGDDRYTTDVLRSASLLLRCPDPDLNRGQLPLQGSALPNWATWACEYFALISVFGFKLFESFLGSNGPAEIRTQDLRHVKATSWPARPRAHPVFAILLLSVLRSTAFIRQLIAPHIMCYCW